MDVQQGKLFGEDFATVDFSSVHFTITCVLSSGGATGKWDQASELTSYYCRRINDPPSDIQLNGMTLLEHSQIGTVIGTLRSQDPQQEQTFVYSVEKPNVLFGCKGNQLINHWHDPRLNGPVAVPNGGINVTVRSTDNGVPPYWSDKVFRITIQDVNDPPESLSLSNSKVYENASLGSLVGRLSAMDGDQASDTKPHSNFKWELVDSDEGRFSLSGENLLVAKRLDYKSQKYHRVVIKCSDYGSPVRSAEKTFVIDVQDAKEMFVYGLSTAAISILIGLIVMILCLKYIKDRVSESWKHMFYNSYICTSPYDSIINRMVSKQAIVACYPFGRCSCAWVEYR